MTVTRLGRLRFRVEGRLYTGLFAVLGDGVTNSTVHAQYDRPVPTGKGHALGLSFGVVAVDGLAEALDEDRPVAVSRLVGRYCAADARRP